MKYPSTIFLKIVIFLIGLLVLAICIVWLPKVVGFYSGMEPKVTYYLYIVSSMMYLSVVPFFFALYQGFKLLTYIDQNIAFSDLSIKALKNIKICAITISVLFLAILPFLYPIADADDAPGLLVFGFIIAFASTVIATFAAVLEKLLRDAIEIKTDNDLTI
jgi:hypothetical protein